jgi:uncharacterized membrane protein
MSAFNQAVFQVVFTGQLRPGVNAEQAARDFAAVFKIAEDKARRLILDQGEHILKHDVDDANAARYRDVLEEIGLEVRVEPAGTPLGGDRMDGAAADDELPPDWGGAAATGAAGAGAAAFDPADPYAPPQADLTPPMTDDDGPMTGPHAVPAGHGWLWIRDAYALFRARPRPWIGALATVYLINVAVSLVPMVGSLVSFVLGPIFGGGLMAGARALDRHGEARVSMVFDGFSARAGQLALVAVFYLVGILAVMLLAVLILVGGGVVSGAGLEALSANDPEAFAAAVAPMAIVLLVLVVMALMIPLIMAYWFAPALVMLEDMTAWEAMQASFHGCWKNIVPFLLYGLVLLVILIGFSIVAGLLVGVGAALAGSATGVLGFIAVLLLVPLLLAAAAIGVLTQYTGYRDIFRHAG